MFSFIDSASDHAAALSHFHSYALFFLILVIVFVVWLLKLVMRFNVFERDLRKVPSEMLEAKIPHFSFVFWLVANALNAGPSYQALMDSFSSLLITKYITKTYYSFSLHRTIYPDQGELINSFLIFPQLVPTTKAYNRPYVVGLLSATFRASQHEFMNDLLDNFRMSKHSVAALFPYDRVEITYCGPYSSVEEYLTLNVLLSINVFFSKYMAYAIHFEPYYNFSRKKGWNVATLDVSSAFGFWNIGNTFFYKKYSSHVLPIALFVSFYTNDLRAFFYLFFQQVKHRKILEWVWTCVPALILLMLLYPSLILLYCYDRPYITKPYLTFKAIGHQWYWSYEYSDFVTSTEEAREHIKFDSYMLHEDDIEFGSFRLLEVDRRIVLPIGVCMRLVTTSSDVLHSWAVPALGVKIDAVPGRLNQFWIVADRPGTFYGQCSELCGVNHGFMPIAVESAPFLDFFKAIAAAEASI